MKVEQDAVGSLDVPCAALPCRGADRGWRYATEPTMKRKQLPHCRRMAGDFPDSSKIVRALL